MPAASGTRRCGRVIRVVTRLSRRLLKKLPRGGCERDPRDGPWQIPRDLVSEPALGLDPRDEARVGQKGTLAYVWARRGTRPRAVQDTRYVSACLLGAVCPQRGIGAGLVMPRANTASLNHHLAEIASP